jgi:hypothetical protein
VGGIIFALFSGTPLIITGVTGPVLLYDEALYGFTKSSEIPFLPWRVWIGIWTFVLALIVAALQGSTLVKFFTKFTKDIFAALVSLLFIFEALKKMVLVRCLMNNSRCVSDIYLNFVRCRYSRSIRSSPCRPTATLLSTRPSRT